MTSGCGFTAGAGLGRVDAGRQWCPRHPGAAALATLSGLAFQEQFCFAIPGIRLLPLLLPLLWLLEWTRVAWAAAWLPWRAACCSACSVWPSGACRCISISAIGDATSSRWPDTASSARVEGLHHLPAVDDADHLVPFPHRMILGLAPVIWRARSQDAVVRADEQRGTAHQILHPGAAVAVVAAGEQTRDAVPARREIRSVVSGRPAPADRLESA